jgi:murein DD-endopeptidase MepM/ murein hydrolase activator NlpD
MNPKNEVQINIILIACLLLLLILLNPIRADGATIGENHESGWRAPVTDSVVKLFRRPLGDYLAGHRGIDFAVVEGEPILSPARGVVSYVGTVFDRTVVVVDHGDGVRSEVEPICPLVHVGRTVQAGTVLGVFCLPESPYQFHCAGLPCLHFSIRKNGEYYAPQVLIGGLKPSRLKVW